MHTLVYLDEASSISGVTTEKIELPFHLSTGLDLRKWIDGRYNGSGYFLFCKVRLAMDGAIASDHTLLASQREIAFLPSVSGG